MFGKNDFHMNILITGSSGFVGKALVNKLNLIGHNVITSSRYNNKFNSNCSSFFKVSEKPFLQDWSSILDRVDCVVHLAAKVHEMDKKKLNDISSYRDINTRFTLHLANQAISAGVKRFIFLSTIKVNGEFTLPQKPFSPIDKPQPSDAYSVSKYEAEIGLSEICKETNMEFVILRVPLIYGSGVKANFKSLVDLLKTKLPLPFGSLCNNRRSLLSLDNLVDFIELCLQHPLASGNIFFVSDDYDFSTSELFKEIGSSIGCPARLFYIPRIILSLLTNIIGMGNYYKRLSGSLQIDISKTKLLLGWKPPYQPSYTFRKL